MQQHGRHLFQNVYPQMLQATEWCINPDSSFEAGDIGGLKMRFLNENEKLPETSTLLAWVSEDSCQNAPRFQIPRGSQDITIEQE